MYNDSSLISTELTILPDRLYIQAIIDNDTDTVSQNKRQITSSRDYSILAPVILTVTIMNNVISVENVTQMIQNIDIDVSSNGNEVIGFNGVGMYVKAMYMHTLWSQYIFIYSTYLNPRL